MEPSVKKRTPSELRNIWNSMFIEEIYTLHEDDEVQGVLMLVEGTLLRMKQFAVDCSKMKSLHKQVSVELKQKEEECSILKCKLNRLKSPCRKCTLFKRELLRAKQKQAEAQKRMNSIAKILNLGDNLDSPNMEGKNSAMNLLSQMLLGNSPKRKKICLEEEVLVQETADILTEKVEKKGNAIIPESIPPPSPLKSIDNFKIPSPMKLASESPRQKNSEKTCSSSLPLMNTPKKTAKKNLSLDFISKNSDEEDIIDESPKKPLLFQITPPVVTNIEIDCVEETPKDKTQSVDKRINDVSTNEKIISETPTNKTKEARWLLKKKSGVSKEISSRGNQLKQLKLGISVKKEVSCKESKHDDEEIIDKSPCSAPRKLGLSEKSKKQDFDSLVFNPLASSTQKERCNTSFDRPPNWEESSSVGYVYQQGAVRNKAERKQLKGWECEECEKYYKALGDQLSPAKIQERINACSRHRSKFNPNIHQTPPEFWNPLFPDTESLRAQGLRLSIRAPKSN
ncbi:uncharacterized protein LOC106670737 [Cimex lectularius]|uniref:DNA endonuclease activator Ctp1 C-terminal domain-containing protein n=1 Tax=Cimex lectularius TaxID=79782 RepID=A0A8I6S637_CIMLE|nr:uncharacterized protein LOC106670737 [Cimex lectularius]